MAPAAGVKFFFFWFHGIIHVHVLKKHSQSPRALNTRGTKNREAANLKAAMYAMIQFALESVQSLKS